MRTSDHLQEKTRAAPLLPMAAGGERQVAGAIVHAADRGG
jgi:hypothetical protein